MNNPQNVNGTSVRIMVVCFAPHPRRARSDAPYPFVPDADVCTICAPDNQPAWRALTESGFSAREWVVREDATHAKSKTDRVGEVKN